MAERGALWLLSLLCLSFLYLETTVAKHGDKGKKNKNRLVLFVTKCSAVVFKVLTGRIKKLTCITSITSWKKRKRDGMQALKS